MKTYKKLWEKFIAKENFELAYLNSVKHKSNQKQVRRFKQNRDANLEQVRQLCISENFHTSRYREKIIYEPKKRVIYKLPYSPDRIVQHAIMNILKPIFMRKLINATYSCIENRGQIAASHKCSEYVRRNRYCLKCDIHKFYPSINQKILSSMIHRFIKDDKFMKVIDDVIFSFPGGYNAPIGNYLSQWFGNFYLSKLDNYVKHTLKCHDYERYCDDFLLFNNDKDYLNDCRAKIEIFLRDNLELEFSRADIFNVKQGVDFCGYRSFGKYVLIRKKTAKRIRRRLRKIENDLRREKSDRIKMQSQLASAKGWLKHSCSYNYSQAVHLDRLMKMVREKS